MATTPQRTIRVSDEEWEEIRARAEAAGDESITAYLLRRALTADRTGELRHALRVIAREVDSALSR